MVVIVSVGMIGVSHSVSGTGIVWASFANSRHSTTARGFTVQIIVNEIRLEFKFVLGLIRFFSLIVHVYGCASFLYYALEHARTIH